MQEVCQHHAGMISDISAIRRELDELKTSLKENSKALNEICIKLNRICLGFEKLEESLLDKKEEYHSLHDKIENLEEFRDNVLGVINFLKWLIGLSAGVGGLSLIMQLIRIVH